MASLVDILTQIEKHLHHLKRPLTRHFQTGLSDSSLDTIEKKCGLVFTGEMRELYKWHNGTRINKGEKLNDLYFFPGFYFLAVEEASLLYQECVKHTQWNRLWFPIFANGAGDFYAVTCGKKKLQKSEIIGFLKGEKEQIAEYECILTMANSLAMAYSKNVFFVERDGTLEMHDDEYQKIAHRFNPTIELWQEE